MKSIFASKVFWFNVISTVLVFTSLPDIEPLMDPKAIALIQGVGNIILRFMTSKSVSATGQKSS